MLVCDSITGSIVLLADSMQISTIANCVGLTPYWLISGVSVRWTHNIYNYIIAAFSYIPTSY